MLVRWEKHYIIPNLVIKELLSNFYPVSWDNFHKDGNVHNEDSHVEAHVETYVASNFVQEVHFMPVQKVLGIESEEERQWQS